MSFIVCRHLALSLPSLSFLGRTESFRLARGERRGRGPGGETIRRAICRVKWIGLAGVREGIEVERVPSAFALLTPSALSLGCSLQRDSTRPFSLIPF